MLISRDINIENENVNLDKGALETASNSVGLPTSIPSRYAIFNTVKMLFPKRIIKLTNKNSINPNDIRKTETFIAYDRKYRITKYEDYLVIEREVLDSFDYGGTEQLKQCAIAIGTFDTSGFDRVTFLTTGLRNTVKNIYLISSLILLICSLYIDVRYSFFGSFILLLWYSLAYLLLQNASVLFNEELTNDINKFRQQSDGE